jgi:hypothetical protein
VEAPGAAATSARSAGPCPTDRCRQDQRQRAWTGLVTQTQSIGVDPWSRKRAEQRVDGTRHEDRQGNDQSNEN